jgi:hypothetical protein
VRTATRVIDIKTPVRSIKFSKNGETVLIREDGEGDASDTVALFDVRAGMNLNRASSKDMGLGHTVRVVIKATHPESAHLKGIDKGDQLQPYTGAYIRR